MAIVGGLAILLLAILAIGCLFALGVLCGSLFSLLSKTKRTRYQAASHGGIQEQQNTATPYSKASRPFATDTLPTRKLNAPKGFVIVGVLLAFLRAVFTIIALFVPIPEALVSFLEVSTKICLYTALIVLKRQFFPAHKKTVPLVLDVAMIVITTGLGLATFILSVTLPTTREEDDDYLSESLPYTWSIADYVATAYAAWVLLMTICLGAVLLWKAIRAKREGVTGLELDAIRKLNIIVIPTMAIMALLVIVAVAVGVSLDTDNPGTIAVLFLALVSLVIGDVLMYEAMRRAILKLQAVNSHENM